ncbi:MAG: hypothetical protein ACFFAS_11635 [Promethearchaeota archaeon]
MEETTDASWIKLVLFKLMDVPDPWLKTRIRSEIAAYLESRLINDDETTKAFVAYKRGAPEGFVTCQLDPHYRSYGRKCATFGWLFAPDAETCNALLSRCETFGKESKYRLLRGPINYPKSVGGIGLQVRGFNRQMLFGVPFGRPRSRVKHFLLRCGYDPKTWYAYVEVSERTWQSERKLSNKFKFVYLTRQEVMEKKEEILDLAKGSFYDVLSDSSGGKDRFDEILAIQARVPEWARSFDRSVDFNDLSTNPLFLEAWNSCDLEKIETLAPIVVERKTGRLAGILLGIPDLYEVWKGTPLTRINVDTALIAREFQGKGLFSALNNLGQLTCRMFGANYFEGTAIWYDNVEAVKSIFPHSKVVRDHVVFQKRIR